MVVIGAAGLIAAVEGLTTAGPQLVMNGPTVLDVAGTAAGLAGFVMIGIAYRAATRQHRRRVHLLGIPILLLTCQFLLVPAFNIGIITHASKPNIRPASSLGYAGARDVTFSTPDGVRLAAWYVPGINHAAVILMHGSHGTRDSELPYLRFLADAGYSVLAVDARGHGESSGETNALGWYGDRDVAGAYNFLRHQSGVDRNRIAGLGISMGAEELLRAPANGIPLAAVVADGAGASTRDDLALEPRGADAPIFNTITWLTYRGVEVLTGENEPAGLINIVDASQAPTLLIASHAPNERFLNQRYKYASHGKATLWYLPDVGHTRGYMSHPRAYRGRVTAFLADALRAN